MINFVKKGQCDCCGEKGVLLANKHEPYCLPCFKTYFFPRPNSSTHKRKTKPVVLHTSNLRFALKSIIDDDNFGFSYRDLHLEDYQ